MLFSPGTTCYIIPISI